MPEVTIKAYKCERCGHVWAPRTERRPTICPKCKSPYWDKPRIKPVVVKETNIKEAKPIIPVGKRV